MTQGTENGGVRVGVIGCGGIGRTHLDAYRANGVQPVALADANAETLERAAAEYGGRPYADGRAMLDAERLDAVSICTPPALHRPMAIAALGAGAAVLCEKPMATTIEDCEAMAAEARHAGKLLTVGFCHRFQPHVERLREMIEGGELGTTLMFRNRFAGHLAGVEQTWFARPDVAGGGVMFDTCVHSVDLFRHLVGEPDEVKAIVSTTATPLGPALEVEDTAIISLRTLAGVLGVIEASWRTPPGEWTVTVYGTAGAATIDYGAGELRVRTVEQPEWQVVDVPPGDRFEREIADFLRCVREGATPRVSAEDGVAATRILVAAYASASERTA
jgi:predicted dehydrogenase